MAFLRCYFLCAWVKYWSNSTACFALFRWLSCNSLWPFSVPKCSYLGTSQIHLCLLRITAPLLLDLQALGLFQLDLIWGLIRGLQQKVRVGKLCPPLSLCIHPCPGRFTSALAIRGWELLEGEGQRPALRDLGGSVKQFKRSSKDLRYVLCRWSWQLLVAGFLGSLLETLNCNGCDPGWPITP